MYQDTSQETPLLKDFFGFIFRPFYIEQFSTLSLKNKIFKVVRFWGIGLVFALVLGFVLLFVLNFFTQSTEHSAIKMFNDDEKLYYFIFFATIYAPAIEELTFRLFLHLSPYRLGFALAFVFLMLSDFFPREFNPFLKLADFFIVASRYHPIVLLITVLSTSLLGIIIGFLINKISSEQIKQSTKRFYVKHFAKIFYFSGLSFAIVHLVNYANLKEIWFLTPLIVAPQLSMSFTLGFIRVKYGLFWSMIAHTLHNTSLIIPLFLITRSKSALDAINEIDISRDYSFSKGLDPVILEKIMTNKDFIYPMLGGSIFIFLVSLAFFIFIYSLWEYFKYRKNIKNKLALK